MKSIFIGLMFAGFIVLAIAGKQQEYGIAIDNLRLFSTANALAAGTCNQYDTDSNGYVSCTAKDKDRMIQLECGSNWATQGTGSCKIPTVTIRNYNNN